MLRVAFASGIASPALMLESAPRRVSRGCRSMVVEDLRRGPLNHRALDPLPPGRIRVPTLSSGTDEVRLGRGILQDSTLRGPRPTAFASPGGRGTQGKGTHTQPE